MYRDSLIHSGKLDHDFVALLESRLLEGDGGAVREVAELLVGQDLLRAAGEGMVSYVQTAAATSLTGSRS